MRQRICDICKEDKTDWCVDKATIYLGKPWIAVHLSFTQDICTHCLPQVIQQFIETMQGKRICIEDSDSAHWIEPPGIKGEVKGEVKVQIRERS